MKAKNIFNLFIFVVILSLSSCSLEEVPYGFYNSGNFFQTEEDAIAGLMYAYVPIPSYRGLSQSFLYANSLSSEEFTLKSDAGSDQHDLDRNQQDGSNNTATRETFLILYLVTGRANTLIEHIPDIKMDENERNHMLGEAYFLRAYGYYNLVRLFGKVPLRLQTLDGFELVGKELSPIQEIYEKSIIPDLIEAENLMDANIRRGRANKVAAQGLLANAYLFLASAKESGLEGYEFVPDAALYYEKAKVEAAKVIHPETSTVFGFDNDYLNIFNVEKETSPELIFYTISSLATVGVKNLASTLTTPYCSEQTFMVPAQHGGFSSYYGWEHMWVEVPFYNTFDDADKRKKAFFCTELTVAGKVHTWDNGTLYVDGVPNSAGYCKRPFATKFLDSNNDGDTGNRYTLVRYSEVLLTYAEACGNSSEGVAALNQIRTRAGLSPYSTSDFANDADYRKAVVQERAWELCFEFQRVYDLRRTKGMEAMAAKYGKTLVKNYYFYEIPQEEYDYNPGLKR
ncbi:membrane protein [Bacteroidia bacterium]|nr:membrane protein [Bacteroidia bacterium]